MRLYHRQVSVKNISLKFHKCIYFTIAAHSYLAALLGTAVQSLRQGCKKYQGKVVFKKTSLGSSRLVVAVRSGEF